jgi:hypothetical protein
MKKHKIVIQIFPMVNEIDYLERTLLLLKQSSVYIDKDKFHIILDVTLPLSDYLTNWDDSILKQDYFINKFKHLEKYAEWFDEYYFNIDYTTKGCADCFINNIYKYTDIDSLISLDIDIIFNSYTLSLILESSLEAKNIQPKYIITPECVKLWDETWDILVNDNFINQSYGYEKNNDPIIDVITLYEDINLFPLEEYKWGGGWFTLYSKELLDYIQLPKDIKGYTPVDTFIMECCKYIPDVTQYKIKNLIIAEDYKYINRTLYDNYIKTINRKQDLFQKGQDRLVLHLHDLIKNKLI